MTFGTENKANRNVHGGILGKRKLKCIGNYSDCDI
jgi:hypothetical protein